MNATANATSANASSTAIRARARVPLTRKVLTSRNAKGALVINGVSYRTSVALQGTTLDVSIDLDLGYAWFSCNRFAGLGCTKTCRNVTEGCVTAATATLELGDATLESFPADFAQGPWYADGLSSYASSTGVGGLIGLGRKGFSATSLWSSARLGKLVDRLSSFSLFLASDATDSSGATSFVMLNGVDDALVAQRKLSPVTVPLIDVEFSRSYKFGMTAFQVGRNNSAALYPCMYYLLYNKSSGCETMFSTSLSHIQMPTHIFSAFARKYLGSGSGCSEVVQVEQHTVFAEVTDAYVCPRSLELPRLAFTFGSATFYLDGKDYTSPHPVDATKVVVELTGRNIEWVLGAKFFEKFYTSFTPRSNVTLYCHPGDDCGVKVVKNPAPPRDTKWQLQNYKDYASAYLRESAPPGPADLADKSTTNESVSASTAGIIVGVFVAIVLVIGAAIGARRFKAHKRKAAMKTIEISTPAAADDLS